MRIESAIPADGDELGALDRRRQGDRQRSLVVQGVQGVRGAAISGVASPKVAIEVALLDSASVALERHPYECHCCP